MLNSYFRNLYQKTMQEAYGLAHGEIIDALREGGRCLDCGAHNGYKYGLLRRSIGMDQQLYTGIEWNSDSVKAAHAQGLHVLQGDLNNNLEFPDASFKCIFGLSVLEHLLKPCNFLRECHRCLEEDGVLVILTPNISTYFTILLLVLGRMPSTGPHPDSNMLVKKQEIFQLGKESLQLDTEADNPSHRHLVVFSYRVLKAYLSMLGFRRITGHGFGLYPFPLFMQGLLQKVDPIHCHQMVFIARK